MYIFEFVVLTLAAPVDTKSIGVNTPSPPDEQVSSSLEGPSRGVDSYSLLLGSEEEELQAMLRELLAAFPTQTTESNKSLFTVFILSECAMLSSCTVTCIQLLPVT